MLVSTNVRDYRSIVICSAVKENSMVLRISEPMLSGSVIGSYLASGSKNECSADFIAIFLPFTSLLCVLCFLISSSTSKLVAKSTLNSVRTGGIYSIYDTIFFSIMIILNSECKWI